NVGTSTEEAVRIGLLEGRQSRVGDRTLLDRSRTLRDQKRLEEVQQLGGSGDATLLVLCEAAIDRLDKPEWQIGQSVADAGVGLVEKVGVPQQSLGRQRIDRVVTRQQLVKHDPRCPQVRSVIGAARFELLG